MHPSSASKHLEAFIKEGLVTKEEQRGLLIYKPTRSDLFLMYKRQWNEAEVRRSGLLAFLNSELAYPTIILFGSYARGENHPRSDMDLFIIADEKKELDLEPYEEKLGVPIHILLHTPEEVQSLRKSNKELLHSVLNGIILEGFLEIL